MSVMLYWQFSRGDGLDEVAPITWRRSRFARG